MTGIETTPTDLADHDLQRRLRSVECLVRDLHRRLGRALGHADLEDIVQSVWIAAWARCQQPHSNDDFDRWAARLTATEVRLRLRERRRSPRSLSNTALDARPERLRSRPSEWAHLLDVLGSPNADVIRLKHFEALSFGQIANRLALSPNTAKTCYYRGLRLLRAMHRRTAS